MNREIEKDGFITRPEDLEVKRAKKQQKSMVLIKDMEKPVSCLECDLKDIEIGCVFGRVYSECPLTAVEPYGPEGTLYKEKQ